MIRPALLALAAVASPAAAQTLVVTSPDGRNTISLAIGAEGRATYAVTRDGATILAPSPLGLDLDTGKIGYSMAVTGSDTAQADVRYPLIGKASEGRDRHNQLTVHLAETGSAKRRMDVVLRAYDSGVAFRVVLPVQPATAAAIVRADNTEFAFPSASYRCWGFNVGHFGSSHEGEYDPVDLTRVRDHNLYDLPFACETGKSAFALAESDLIDFAGLYLTARPEGGPGLAAKLSPSLDDRRVAVRTRIGSPIATPWRVVMLGDTLGALNQSTLITDLATPSRIADTRWIKPGKSSWDWWNGPTLAALPDAGSNTATARAFIDFSAANGLPYAMIDEGWYMGAGGGGTVRPGVDVTRWSDTLDLEKIAAYAKSKGVGLWLWANWKALDDQMEEALTVYERLGIAGIKVDFMDRDDQWMVNWYAKLLAAAARHHLMVDLHGAYVPRGLQRTYPNFVTQEGVLGAEYNKWTRRITAEHNVMLAYTRNLLGPMDYTPGGFRNTTPGDFTPRVALPFVQTTRAHGLAMYVVYDSPLAIVADSPDTYAASSDGLDFVRNVPTTWDETRFLGGETGKWIALARRSGKRWYVGVMNGPDARKVSVPFDFLGGRKARMKIWQDGAAPAAITTSNVSGDRTGASIDLAASGGAVAVIDVQ